MSAEPVRRRELALEEKLYGYWWEEYKASGKYPTTHRLSGRAGVSLERTIAALKALSAAGRIPWKPKVKGEAK